MGRKTAEALRHFFEMTVQDQWAMRGLMLAKIAQASSKQSQPSTQTKPEPKLRKITLGNRTFYIDRRDPNRTEHNQRRRAADALLILG